MNWAVFFTIIGGFGGFVAVITFAISASEREELLRNRALIAFVICLVMLAAGIGLQS